MKFKDEEELRKFYNSLYTQAGANALPQYQLDLIKLMDKQ